MDTINTILNREHDQINSYNIYKFCDYLNIPMESRMQPNTQAIRQVYREERN